MTTVRKELEGSTEYRHNNFMALLEEFRQETMPDEPTRGLLKAFGEFVGVSERYLSHVKCKRKPMGPKIARQIEQAFRKPKGWLDLPQGGAILADDPQQRADLEMMQTLLRVQPERARAMLQEQIKLQMARANAMLNQQEAALKSRLVTREAEPESAPAKKRRATRSASATE